MIGRSLSGSSGAALLLGALAAVDVVATARSAGYGVAGATLPAALLGGIGAWLLLERAQDRLADLGGCVAMLIGAQLGMIVGLSFDFGTFGLVILSSWCAAPDTAYGAIRVMASVAPAMHVGMFFGGLLAAALAAPLTGPRAVVALVLMTVAMPLADALAWGYVQFSDGGGVLMMSLCHLCAMFVVMAAGAFAITVKRGRRTSKPTNAARESPLKIPASGAASSRTRVVAI
jgi:hypothetical protein